MWRTPLSAVPTHTFVALVLGFGLALAAPAGLSAQSDGYFPPPGAWERREPAEVGMNPQALAEAVRLAQESTRVEPTDLRRMITNSFGDEPHFSIIGPVKDREGGSGLVIRNGYIVAEWGDLERADMTFSVSKSYLSTMAGLALDDGLIQGVSDRVAEYVDHESFSDPHNAPITWEHLLTQSSDWRGELFGKPDWADRPISRDTLVAKQRDLHEPGTHFKYNDVRVNLLALSLLHVWRQPLPEVLQERVMDPIGASDAWEWNGYENSRVEIDGDSLRSVSGGGHWGGGFIINTLDHARFGYLFLRGGEWDGRRLLSGEWIAALAEPSPAQDNYGYMWWLNTDRRQVPSAPESAFYASGAGGNYIWVDRENDLLIVLRWVPRMGAVVSAITEAIEEPIEEPIDE